MKRIIPAFLLLSGLLLWQPAVASGGGGHGAPAKKADTHAKSASGHGTEEELPNLPAVETPEPVVSILGRSVISDSDRARAAAEAAIPESLKDEQTLRLLSQKRDIPFYEHAPTKGDPAAPVTVVLFNDLSCLQCMNPIKKVDEAVKAHAADVYYVHVHLPVDDFNATNPAAFYGRLAHKLGLFWEYREQVMKSQATSSEQYMQILVDLGVDPSELRKLIRSYARQAYQELDADHALCQRLHLERPPVVFINGIKVAEGGLLDNVGDVITFLIDKYQLDQLK